MDYNLIILVAVLVAVAGYFILKSPTKFTDVTIGNVTIKAEIADTWPKQVRGLMFRSSLPSDQGMLFVFTSDGYPSIWMMNVSFPLDIIWIDSQHKIVDIKENAQPCRLFCPTYNPKSAAHYVLEVNAGFVKENNVSIGEEVKFNA